MNIAPTFIYQDNDLFIENIPVKTLAKEYGTPVYLYSTQALKKAWSAYQDVKEAYSQVLICYAVKANSNLAVLKRFAEWGAGFDIVSGGELARVLKAGGAPQNIIFSGVGKQVWEMQEALNVGIKCFNVESIPELELLSQVAQSMGKTARISLRVNPDVDAKTHPYISTGLKENKFGIDIAQAKDIYLKASTLPHIQIVGLDCHIGSQITEISPFIDAVDKLIALLNDLKTQGIHLHHLDIGGGLGIRYVDENPPQPIELVRKVKEQLANAGFDDLELILEPGRSLVGNAGGLLTQVQFIKSTPTHQFAIVDAAMNDLIRPTLYDAYHGVLVVEKKSIPAHTYNIVGPICETGDWLAKARELAIDAQDYVLIESVGAYGFAMSSQYNTRPRAAEVLVDGDKHYLIRERETIEQLFALEKMV